MAKDIAAILIVGPLIIWLIWCGVHGYWMDMIEGHMHDDCIKCQTYRLMHSSDAAFQIRDISRN